MGVDFDGLGSCSFPKDCSIFWLVAKNRLLTRDKLHYVSNDIHCPICGNSLETRDHLLIECPLVGQVRDQILLWLCIPEKFTSLTAILRWATKHARKKTVRTKFIKASFAATIYC